MLVDAAGLWFRAFYALPESITAPDGSPVNAVRGFCDMLAALLERDRPKRLAVCLDLDWRPKFRVDLLPEYKAQRVAPGEDLAAPGAAASEPASLAPQVDMILALLGAAGVATVGAEGFEADDVIGTLAARERRDDVVVVTGDRDLLQVVADEPVPVRVRYIGRGVAKSELLGPAEVAERYGLPPERAGAAYAELAVLRGDPSDGLPGVAGVGEKTAAKLISAFGSLAGTLEAAKNGDVAPPKAQKALLAAEDYIRRAARVVFIRDDVPVQWDRDDAITPRTADLARCARLAEQFGTASSAQRLLTALYG
ncbi:5'-3' exonuclease, N-terminal resolvase-like domain protein [Segniliparus rotundus DSM 44985]|uniref:5'-3' exonuclease n=1 Tax=Segniliparus rotundus (strain ATCC BAA-972 / CDC 1076 / CIP 108378 / DSM 44985 / JCM 13578) TaxID=640132 RepID=D6Z8E7_SEGRD|nr:5'-3' exonuclease [Segniliparus rotundus]ADG98227.1 5'-3' exonuclease, N-terminal resolvase-like domain protein [Segniliparus rotundus DSM 44985]